MKLIRAIERAEASARRRRAGLPIGMVWSSDESAYAGELEEGQKLATDLQLLEGGGVHSSRGNVMYLGVRSIERLARDAGDLGDVISESGELAGRVVAVDGCIVSIEWLVGGPVAPFRVHAGGDVVERMVGRASPAKGAAPS